MKSSERWWACFSFKQRAVHVETESEGLARNLRAVAAGRLVDFIPLAVFGSEGEASAFLRKLQQRRREGRLNLNIQDELGHEHD